MRLKKLNGSGIEFKVTHSVTFENLVDATLLVWDEDSEVLSEIKKGDVNRKMESLLRMHGLEGFQVLKNKITDLQERAEAADLEWKDILTTVQAYTREIFREFSKDEKVNPFARKLAI